ncbi:hypothetical protein Y032_0548g3284 [Ancylostoma ceylanicum]|nr:hypothetical protein Y032_0548g3284 [Ancylostoma ceylanicum]
MRRCYRIVGIEMWYVILFLAFFDIAQARPKCRCANMTLEESYCAAEFVIHAKVTGRKKALYLLDYTTFDIENMMLFKIPDDKTIGNQIYTMHSRMCGAKLKVKKQYLLGGTFDEHGRPLITKCGLVQEWPVKNFDENHIYRCPAKPVEYN